MTGPLYVSDRRGPCILCERIGTIAVSNAWYCEDHIPAAFTAVRLHAIAVEQDPDEAEHWAVDTIRQYLKGTPDAR